MHRNSNNSTQGHLLEKDPNKINYRGELSHPYPQPSRGYKTMQQNQTINVLR